VTGSAYNIGMASDAFWYEFKSVENASITLAVDREQILEAMIATFGSIQETDQYLRGLVDTMLSKHSDKPWNKPKANDPGRSL
jgi:hypothetical protein